MLAFVVIVCMCALTAGLFVRGQRAIATAPEASEHGEDAWTWVFLVAALNEEITIGDSIDRLLALKLEQREVIVIDDGSDDMTQEILSTYAHPDLMVLRRDLPNARKGKAQALNAAYHRIGSLLPHVDRSRVLVVVVDADGRIAPDAARFAAAHFADPEVGGLQALVRIYNRGGYLTRMQDVEFSVYGSVYQAGRNRAGTAGMGGNGQFNRLSALDDVVEADGPWRNRLTEDQDRRPAAARGGLEVAPGDAGGRGAAGRPAPAPAHATAHPLVAGQPAGASTCSARPGARRSRARPRRRGPLPADADLADDRRERTRLAIVLAATGRAAAPPARDDPRGLRPRLLERVLGCLATPSRERLAQLAAGDRVAHLYALYTWLLFPVLVRAMARSIGRGATGRGRSASPAERPSVAR